MAPSVEERFNVQVFGNGSQAMMFAHGLGCDQSMWRFITPEFEADYKIILFDFSGSRNSDLNFYNNDKYSSLQGYADDVIEIINYIQLTQIVFVGHSVSSMIGMLAAIKEPGLFKHLIMVSPSPCYFNDKDYNGGFDKTEIEALLHKLKADLEGWSNAFAPIIMGNTERPALTDELKESFVSTDHEVLYNFAKVTFQSDLRGEVEKLTTPTLIMQCSEDLVAPVDVGLFLKSKLPNSEIVHMQATGHCAHLSEPAETIMYIKKYLKKSTT